MWRLTVVAVAAGLILIVAAEAAADGFWLPPDFGANNPNLAVAVGDSITLGTLGSGGQAAQPYPLVLESLLAPAHPGFVILNRGQGGETTRGGLTRLATILVADHPGFVLVMEGTNDATFEMPPDIIVANLREMVRLAKANGSTPLLGAIIPNHRDAPDAQAIIAAVNARLPSVAAEEGVRFVDTFTPLNDPGLYGPDRLHPTQQGYEVLGAAWQAAVSAAITESRAILWRHSSHQRADFNGDGKADILWRHTSGALAVWLMNGASVIATGNLGTVDLAWTIESIGDFDGDGKADILWRHTAGFVHLWVLSGASVISASPVATVPPDWTIQPIGDFNGDGKTDILWRHTAGFVDLWVMNGASVISASPVATVPPDWTIQ